MSTLQIHDLEDIGHLQFLNAGRGPGRQTRELLPVQHGVVGGMPAALDALIVTADLQSRMTPADAKRFASCGGPQYVPKSSQVPTSPLPLLGEALPFLMEPMLEQLFAKGVDCRDPSRIGVLLAGDFYTVPQLDARGGTGDVAAVWRAMAENYRWVAGVAGNHDGFADVEGRLLPHPLDLPSNARCLDSAIWERDGLRIAGLGGIVGNPKRMHRRTEEDYALAIMELLEQPHDLLIMHDGPSAPRDIADLPDSAPHRGQHFVRELLESASPRLIVRGHSHWNPPLAALANGAQVLNVDERVVVLTRSSA